MLLLILLLCNCYEKIDFFRLLVIADTLSISICTRLNMFLRYHIHTDYTWQVQILINTIRY